MWVDKFTEHVRKERIKQYIICEIMEITPRTYIEGVKNKSFKFQNILKAYNHFKWNLNELQDIEIDNNNTLNEENITYKNKNKINETINNDKKIESLYEKRLEEKDAEIKYLRKFTR